MISDDSTIIKLVLSHNQAEALTAEAKALKVSRSEYIRALLLRGRDGLNFAFFQKQLQALNDKMEKLQDITPAAAAPMQAAQPVQTVANSPAIEKAINDIHDFIRFRFIDLMPYDATQTTGINLDKDTIQKKAMKDLMTSLKDATSREV